ncbi:hypothetical protein PCASD_25359 [Puccinia coronata f. sp. avenae]|uniref:Uncharacterized protein n=1 Tax=Puccinia coronata f. sp. avenae TaxID=200324 RepID=A0A2N5RV11_9BASI|nr:hypothetical protein PCASD_25359 [Puccinia coronata f. sp. avenae]
MTHVQLCSNISSELEDLRSNNKEIVLDGYNLTPTQIAKITDDQHLLEKMREVSNFWLQN